MLDEDLAVLYDVEIKVLNQAVKRNIERFPEEFMFQLTGDEYDFLRSQIVTLENHEIIKPKNIISNDNRGKHRKYLPYVFTEQGVAMISGVLRSDTAIKISIQIMNAFVAMRKFISENGQIFDRLDRIEKRQIKGKEHFPDVADIGNDRIGKPCIKRKHIKRADGSSTLLHDEGDTA